MERNEEDWNGTKGKEGDGQVKVFNFAKLKKYKNWNGLHWNGDAGRGLSCQVKVFNFAKLKIYKNKTERSEEDWIGTERKGKERRGRSSQGF